MRKRKILAKVLTSSKNIRFNEFVELVEAFGFELDRIRGSHHIFKHPKIRELINIQNVKGNVKPYQIKQFLAIVEKYNLELEE